MTVIAVVVVATCALLVAALYVRHSKRNLVSGNGASPTCIGPVWVNSSFIPNGSGDTRGNVTGSAPCAAGLNTANTTVMDRTTSTEMYSNISYETVDTDMQTESDPSLSCDTVKADTTLGDDNSAYGVVQGGMAVQMPAANYGCGVVLTHVPDEGGSMVYDGGGGNTEHVYGSADPARQFMQLTADDRYVAEI